MQFADMWLNGWDDLNRRGASAYDGDSFAHQIHRVVPRSAVEGMPVEFIDSRNVWVFPRTVYQIRADKQENARRLERNHTLGRRGMRPRFHLHR